MIKFELPLYVAYNGKKIPLNLNWYRNAHHYVNHQVKKEYWPLESQPFKASRIAVHYRLVVATKRRTDAQNWLSVADKFFLDWLVNRGYIPDDSTAHYSVGSWEVVTDYSAKENRLYADVEVLR